MRRRSVLKGAVLGAGALALPSVRAAAAAHKASEPSIAIASAPEAGARSLDDGWRFHLGDIPFSKLIGHQQSYFGVKAGAARDAAGQDYDDSDWRELSLPHDWAIENAAVPQENGSQGFRRRGIAWYRRALRLDPASRGHYLELQFGAIATNATIWFNGDVVAHNWSGYNSVYIDITAGARFGDDLNSIAVRVDADATEGWWYEGAGIYREVWLIERAPVHIVTDGVHANPRFVDGAWRVPIEATLYNIGKADTAVEVVAELIDPQGRIIGRAAANATAVALQRSRIVLAIEPVTPRLWSIETPTLYRVRTRVLRAGSVVDERVTRCGFRTLRFDANEGFFLNGRHRKIQGVCIHQDHAGVGVAVPAAIIDWRVRQLKALGCNAIRSAHNAPHTALLDACDRHGMLVMDENRLFNVSPDYVPQLEWLIRRDRNRPCVFLWSVFNEEPMQGTQVGYEMVRRMVSVVKGLDDTRPVTAAMNDGMFTPINVSQAVDVMGFNYQQGDYDRFHALNPALPITSSEDTCGLMTRGAWENDEAAQVKTSDDTQKASWGATHRAAWKAIAERPFVAGSFAWTGFDYHGEPTPFPWPAKSSYFGIMDLCGFPKTAFFIRQAHWIKDRPVLAIAPHWTWPGREGRPIKVLVMSNGDHARLELNGRPVGEGPIDPYDLATFTIPYTPGRLTAIVTKAGRAHATSFIETTGAPVALRLTPDRRALAGDGRDAVPITVDVVDAKGRAVPTANLPVVFQCTGGRIIGLGNGDPTAPQLGKGDRQSLFNGLAQVIVQSDAGSRGTLALVASTPGVRAASLALTVARASVSSEPVTPPVQRVTGWHRSPLFSKRPDPTVPIAEAELNSWPNIIAGNPSDAAAAGGWCLVGTIYRPGKAIAVRGGIIRLTGVAGAGELWADGVLLASKTDAAAGPLTARITPGAQPRALTLLLRARTGEPLGLEGVVLVERAP